jgi:hypothetical protein
VLPKECMMAGWQGSAVRHAPISRRPAHQVWPGLAQVRVKVDRDCEQAARVGGQAQRVAQRAAVGRKATVVDGHTLGPARGP